MNRKNDIYKRAALLAVPMMIQNGITNAVGLVDNVMVGSLGTEAITGVSIVGQLIFVFNLAVFGGISGPGIYGAQYYGQGNTEGLKKVFRIKQWICLACLLMGLAVFIFGGETLIGLYLRGESADIDKAETMRFAKEYLSIMLLGLPPFAMAQGYVSSLRETGDSVKPMISGVISVAVDIVFNYLLIYGKLGFPELGVRGAAIATVMARFVEFAVIVIWSHLRSGKHAFLHGVYKTLLVDRETASRIIRKGLPIFLNEMMWAGSLAAMTQCYSTRGLDIVAGLNISNALCNLFNVVFVALGTAVGILSGQTLGASLYEKAKKDAFRLMWFCGGVCVFVAAVLCAVSAFFPKFYDTTSDIRALATRFIIITALFFPVQGFLNALYFTLRSGGKTLITFLFDSVFSWTVALPLALCLCKLTALPILTVYAIVQAADIIKVTVGFVLIKKGIWISNIVSS